VLFSDVKSFTSISEKLSPANLVLLLNDYLTRQSEQILEREGVVDKFIGDAVMAFFGDPVPVPDHALRACRAAVRCREVLVETEPLAERLGVPALKNRIGINSGLATVGNMGSAKRFNYTAMGDTVNFASRLESANKAFGSAILVGPLTYEQAKASIVARPIARVVVVGQREPMAVYELLGMAGETDEATVALANAYSAAHAAVLADDLDEARRRLLDAVALRPADGPSIWLSRLVDELGAGRRPRPWDGVFVLDEK
jgi:adenylate cyclase